MVTQGVAECSPVSPTSQIVSELATTWRSYLPEHALQLLLTAESVNNPPVTQRIEAITLFADVVGFTAMTESLADRGS